MTHNNVDLHCVAATIVSHIDQHFPVEEAACRQVLCLAEEVGEFVGAYRRANGMARRNGSFDEVCAELADVVITSYVTAHVLGIDLDDAITKKLRVLFTRGWKDDDNHGM